MRPRSSRFRWGSARGGDIPPAMGAPALLLAGLLLLPAAPLSAQFNSIETKNQQLITYGPMLSYLAPHLARCFENSLRTHEAIWDYVPTEKTQMIFHDLADSCNAAATSVPHNMLVVNAAPFSYVYETLPGNERLNCLMNHELTHVLTIDKASATDRFFRNVFFGKVSPVPEAPLSILYGGLTSPRLYSPRWFMEGIAVFMETWMAGGIGRALGAYDEMAFRTLVHDDAEMFDRVGLESYAVKMDFQVGAMSYLYGTRFFNYLALQYGPESLIRWVSRTDDSKSYFSSQFQQIFGKPLDQAWNEWRAFEREFQQKNLQSLRAYPTTQSREITSEAVGSLSRPYYDPSRGKLYMAVAYPGQVAHVASVDVATGAVERLCDVKGPANYFVSSVAYDPSTGTLFYTTDNKDWRDIRAVDVRTGRSRQVMKDARIGDIAFNGADRSLWGVQRANGISSLARIPEPYTNWVAIFTWPYGKDIYDLDISPDGKRISAALTEPTGRQSLILMDVDKLLKGEQSYETLYDFEYSSPENFVFTPDGKYLVGTSFYSGVSNVYRYDLELRDIQIMSNCETGFFRPMPYNDREILVYEYTARGFVPAVIPFQPVANVNAIRFLGQEVVEKHPIVKSWKAGSPASIDLDTPDVRRGRYHDLTSMRLTSIYPVVEGYKDFPVYGLKASLSSPFSTVDFTAGYSPNTNLPGAERTHLKLSIRRTFWKLSGTYNTSDFYDLFGPTKASRKGYSYSLEHFRTLVFDEPNRYVDYSIRAAAYGDMDRLPDYQNISTDIRQMFTLRGKFNYQYLTKSQGAIDDEKGHQWQIIADASYVKPKVYPRVYANLDYGFPLRLHRSSVWLRSSAGVAAGNRESPFANFYFGGFGNNWVDHLTETRYRESYSFPGVDLNEIGGTNYGKLLVEWNVPPVIFHRLGWPSCYLNYIRPAVFGTVLGTNLDDSAVRRTLFDAGVQLDFRFIVLSRLNMTLSVGAAAAVEKDHAPSSEFMASLKIL
ncbi:MAG: hypothetical protein AB1714_29340 [Acidobacteriota bacterium]